MRVLLLVVFLTGCAGQARTDYYLAIAEAAKAQSATQQAKYAALANMARSNGGDSSAAVAAVMALALTREQTLQPQYIEDEALSYTRALAAPVAGIAALWIQADSNKSIADSQAQTSRISIAANRDIQTNSARLNASTINAVATRGNAGTTQALGIVETSLGLVSDVAAGGFSVIENVTLDTNELINDLSVSLQPIVQPVVEVVPVVEITPIVEITPTVEITPIIEDDDELRLGPGDPI